MENSNTLGEIGPGARGTREWVHARGPLEGRMARNRPIRRWLQGTEEGRKEGVVRGRVVGVARCVCGRAVPTRPFSASFDARNGSLSTNANC